MIHDIKVDFNKKDELLRYTKVKFRKYYTFDIRYIILDLRMLVFSQVES